VTFHKQMVTTNTGRQQLIYIPETLFSLFFHRNNQSANIVGPDHEF